MTAEPKPLEFLEAVRVIAGLGTASGLAVTVARMLAAARLCPSTREGVPGFLDQGRELTKADWLAINQSLAKHWKAAPGRSENPFERPAESPQVTPGALEQLRQVILGHMGGGSTGVPQWLLQSALELGHPREIFGRGLDPNVHGLIAESAEAVAGTRVFCAYDGAAGIALELAGRGADVTLDVPELSWWAVCSCLALAADLRLRVRHGDPLALARADIGAAPLFPDEYDVSVVVPPFGMRHPSHAEDALGTALPTPTGSEAVGVTLALSRGKKAALCLLPPGFLFRSAKADQIFREQAIGRYGLDTIVGLPRGIFGSTAIAASLLIFKPTEMPGTRAAKPSEVFMIDARGIWNAPDPDADAVRHLVHLIRSHEVTEISAPVAVAELAANDFNLSVERYILAPEAMRLRELTASAITVPLEDLVELYRPQAIPAAKGAVETQQAGLVEVGVADIDEVGLVRLPGKQLAVTPDSMLSIRRARLEPGDVLLVIKGSAGKVGFVRDIPEDATWLASQSFAILRLRQHGPMKNSRVLFRFLNSSLGQATLQSMRVGVAVPGLQMADVRRLAIVLPSVKEQEAIAGEVDGLFALQDQIHQLRAELASRQGQIWPDTATTAPVPVPERGRDSKPKSPSRRKSAS